MIFASRVFRKGNRCAQVYVTDFGWAKDFPLASRCKAHETLSLLFAWNVFPLASFRNIAKEMIQDKFYQKLKDAACHLKQLELYTSWSNAAEREIEELRKGTGCELCWSRAKITV